MGAWVCPLDQSPCANLARRTWSPRHAWPLVSFSLTLRSPATAFRARTLCSLGVQRRGRPAAAHEAAVLAQPRALCLVLRSMGRRLAQACARTLFLSQCKPVTRALLAPVSQMATARDRWAQTASVTLSPPSACALWAGQAQPAIPSTWRSAITATAACWILLASAAQVWWTAPRACAAVLVRSSHGMGDAASGPWMAVASAMELALHWTLTDSVARRRCPLGVCAVVKQVWTAAACAVARTAARQWLPWRWLCPVRTTLPQVSSHNIVDQPTSLLA